MVIRSFNYINYYNFQYTKILGPLPLKRHLKIADIENIFWAVQSAIKDSGCDPINNFTDYILSEELNDEQDIFNNMVSQTDLAILCSTLNLLQNMGCLIACTSKYLYIPY